MATGRRSGWSLALLVTLAACGGAEPAEPAGMWSGPFVKERPRDPASRPVPTDGKPWPPTLSDEERERCKQAAWTAIRTPEVWTRWIESPASAAELKLSEDGLRIDPLPPDFATVRVAILSGGMIGWHPAYIGVTVARGTDDVLEISSSFWP